VVHGQTWQEGNKMRILKNNKTNKYYGINLKCSICHKEIIGELAMLHYCWHENKSKKPSTCSILCVKCTPKANKHYTIEERYPIICIPEKKLNKSELIPFVHYSCDLSDSKSLSVFDAANLESDKTVDKTRFAGKESWFGASIGVMEQKAISQNNIIDLKNIKKLLNYEN
jgi:hypothetical protein